MEPSPPPSPAWSKTVDCCFPEDPEDTRTLEAELSRAVVVTIYVPRLKVDSAAEAATIHADFSLRPMDFSIRSFYPNDFLVPWRDINTRNTLVAGGHAMSDLFVLSLRPWVRQAHDIDASMPYLVPLALRGVTPIRGLVAQQSCCSGDSTSLSRWLSAHPRGNACRHSGFGCARTTPRGSLRTASWWSRNQNGERFARRMAPETPFGSW
ncbi:hypothetical protein ZWY2020_024736 [Hordeum vulgare]|nr:hypothetical protein ZWY2020_024736 [Hordeum vulgare]